MSFSNRIKIGLAALVVTLAGVGAVLAPTSNVYASWGDNVNEGINTVQSSDVTDLPTVVQRIIQTVLMIVGLLAVVMIIVGGVQYTTSAGKQESVTKAKNTIIYGIVGLVISLLAYAIVTFVVGKLSQ